MSVVMTPPFLPLVSHKPQTTVMLVDRAEAENKVVVGEISNLMCQAELGSMRGHGTLLHGKLFL